MTYKFWPLFRVQWNIKQDCLYGFYMSIGVSTLIAIGGYDLSIFDRTNHSLWWFFIVNVVWWSFVLVFNMIACAFFTIMARYTARGRENN